MGLLDRLMFWRTADSDAPEQALPAEATNPDFPVKGCFTLPGAELTVPDALEPESDPG